MQRDPAQTVCLTVAVAAFCRGREEAGRHKQGAMASVRSGNVCGQAVGGIQSAGHDKAQSRIASSPVCFTAVGTLHLVCALLVALSGTTAVWGTASHVDHWEAEALSGSRRLCGSSSQADQLSDAGVHRMLGNGT